jgi:hypothetical protein
MLASRRQKGESKPISRACLRADRERRLPPLHHVVERSLRHLPIRARVTFDRVRPPRLGGDNSPGARESDAIFVYPHATVLHLLSTPDGFTAHRSHD